MKGRVGTYLGDAEHQSTAKQPGQGAPIETGQIRARSVLGLLDTSIGFYDGDDCNLRVGGERTLTTQY